METALTLDEMANEYRERTRPVDPIAPVQGGMRWRSGYDKLAEVCLKRAGYDLRHPDASDPEPPVSTAPRIITTPPEEARVGETYTYKAKAFDGIATGFQWRLTKGNL